VVLGPGPAQVVDFGQVLGHIIGDAIGELHLVDRPVRAALAAGAVVGYQEDQRVLALPGALGGSNGVQSGTESLISTLIVPLNCPLTPCSFRLPPAAGTTSVLRSLVTGITRAG
jgi:hypothetical protein